MNSISRNLYRIMSHNPTKGTEITVLEHRRPSQKMVTRGVLDPLELIPPPTFFLILKMTVHVDLSPSATGQMNCFTSDVYQLYILLSSKKIT